VRRPGRKGIQGSCPPVKPSKETAKVHSCRAKGATGRNQSKKRTPPSPGKSGTGQQAGPYGTLSHKGAGRGLVEKRPWVLQKPILRCENGRFTPLLPEMGRAQWEKRRGLLGGRKKGMFSENSGWGGTKSGYRGKDGDKVLRQDPGRKKSPVRHSGKRRTRGGIRFEKHAVWGPESGGLDTLLKRSRGKKKESQGREHFGNHLKRKTEKGLMHSEICGP